MGGVDEVSDARRKESVLRKQVQILWWKTMSTSLEFGSNLYVHGLPSTLKKQIPDVNFVPSSGKGRLCGDALRCYHVSVIGTQSFIRGGMK